MGNLCDFPAVDFDEVVAVWTRGQQLQNVEWLTGDLQVIHCLTYTVHYTVDVSLYLMR